MAKPNAMTNTTTPLAAVTKALYSFLFTMSRQYRQIFPTRKVPKPRENGTGYQTNLSISVREWMCSF